MKKAVAVLAALAMLLVLVSAVSAASQIKLVVNGEELLTDVAPMNISGRILVPVRVLAEKLGAEVSWDGENQTVSITTPVSPNQDNRIQQLERTLAPTSPEAAISAWAEAVKTRNGALQYALMSPELKQASYDELAAANWSTGTSSPWIDSYTVTDKGQINDQSRGYVVEYTYTDSTRTTFTKKEFVTIQQDGENWFVSAKETVDLSGRITTLTPTDDNKITILVENPDAFPASYDKAVVTIDDRTVIYQGDTWNQLSMSGLKEGDQVEVVFSGPLLMSYPVQGGAKTVRVY